MRIIDKIKPIQTIIQRARAEGKTIGLVPTMGALHEGHLSLIRKARIDCNIVVVSIYVNPIQFGKNEDFRIYPRTLAADMELVDKERVDYIFAPGNEEMYPKGFTSTVGVGKLSQALCGVSRPGHFRGVATVVTKLFNIVQPDLAYFGQKDAQQTIVIRRMVADLNMRVQVVVLPTVRDKDGLALSSRNAYLSAEERRAALILPKALNLAQDMIKAGEKDPRTIKEQMRRLIEAEPRVVLEYVEVCDSEQLQESQVISGGNLVALAARVGKTRLIDNFIVPDSF